jgi:hypothetical protein
MSIDEIRSSKPSMSIDAYWRILKLVESLFICPQNLGRTFRNFKQFFTSAFLFSFVDLNKNYPNKCRLRLKAVELGSCGRPNYLNYANLYQKVNSVNNFLFLKTNRTFLKVNKTKSLVHTCIRRPREWPCC